MSATFAASLVTSPALGAYLQDLYSETVVIWIATAVALLDVFFIMVAVPESLPEKLRPASWGSAISWEKADPFGVRGLLSVWLIPDMVHGTQQGCQIARKSAILRETTNRKSETGLKGNK